MKTIILMFTALLLTMPVNANDRREVVEKEVEQIIEDLDKLVGVDLDETLISYLR